MTSRHRVFVTISLLLACALAAFTYSSMWGGNREQLNVQDELSKPQAFDSGPQQRPSGTKAEIDQARAFGHTPVADVCRGSRVRHLRDTALAHRQWKAQCQGAPQI